MARSSGDDCFPGPAARWIRRCWIHHRWTRRFSIHHRSISIRHLWTHLRRVRLKNVSDLRVRRCRHDSASPDFQTHAIHQNVPGDHRLIQVRTWTTSINRASVISADRLGVLNRLRRRGRKSSPHDECPNRDKRDTCRAVLVIVSFRLSEVKLGVRNMAGTPSSNSGRSNRHVRSLVDSVRSNVAGRIRNKPCAVPARSQRLPELRLFRPTPRLRPTTARLHVALSFHRESTASFYALSASKPGGLPVGFV